MNVNQIVMDGYRKQMLGEAERARLVNLVTERDDTLPRKRITLAFPSLHRVIALAARRREPARPACEAIKPQEIDSTGVRVLRY